MLLFQPPPPTRYDLRFTLFDIPVRVHPLFWIIALLLGSSSRDILSLLIWVPVVFVSILVHELGHALAMRYYGQPSQIVLHFAGGLTVPQPVQWGSRWASVGYTARQEILISLAGPGAGFLLALLVLGAVVLVGGSVGVTMLAGVIPLVTAAVPVGGRVLNLIVSMLLWVNIFWGLINLVPVYPLDGGKVAQNVLVQVDPIDGGRKSLWLSVIAGAIVAVFGLLFLRSLYMAVLFGFLAFQSYQTLRGRTSGGF
jgi:Zn-dependent protease